LFADYGPAEAEIAADLDTGRSKGFGFVEIPDERLALRAIESLNGTAFMDRPLTIQVAKTPRRLTMSFRDDKRFANIA